MMLKIGQSLLIEHGAKTKGNLTDLFFETRDFPLTDPP